MEIEIVQARPEHASIVPHLRAADIEEIRASTGLPPCAAVAYSIAASKAWCVLLDGAPIVLWGLGPPEMGNPAKHPGSGPKALVWLVGTEEIERYPVMFYRVSKRLFPQVCAWHEELANWVDARNILSLRWLAWLGFDIGKPEPHGVLGLPFHFVKFRKEKPACAQ